jgi:hypothetical protein
MDYKSYRHTIAIAFMLSIFLVLSIVQKTEAKVSYRSSQAVTQQGQTPSTSLYQHYCRRVPGQYHPGRRERVWTPQGWRWQWHPAWREPARTVCAECNPWEHYCPHNPLGIDHSEHESHSGYYSVLTLSSRISSSTTAMAITKVPSMPSGTSMV